MLNVTVQQFGSATIPSFPTIGISTKPFEVMKKTATRVTQKITENKYINAFTIVLTAPVD